MEIKTLKIENFLAIGEIEADLSNKGLVLIQGENVDDSSQDSNGSGKSSFPDAISWCLFGATARGETGDSVINRTAKKGCRVQLVIEDGDEQYLIVRHRKFPKFKNALHVTAISKSTGAETDLTCGTDKLTQAQVVKIIGCSQEVFNAAIYAGQDAMPDLPGMTDKQLKMLIEESAGTELLQQAYEIAKQRTNETKSDLASAMSESHRISDAIEQIVAAIDDTEIRKSRWEDDRKTQIREMLDESKAFAGRAKDVKTRLDEMSDESDIDAELTSVTVAIESVDEERKQAMKLSRDVDETERAVGACQLALDKAKQDALARKDDVTAVNDEVGKPCSACGKPHTEEDLIELKTRRKGELETAVAEVKKYKADLPKLQDELERTKQTLADFKHSMTDISKAVARQKSLNDTKREIGELKSKVERLETQAVDTLDRAKRLKTSKNPFDDQLEKQQKQLKERQRALEKQKKEIKSWEKAVAVAEEAQRAYGPAGVRAHILDNVTPFLNSRTAHYLSYLTDGNISAVWSTLSTTKSGEVREKFKIEVTSSTGAASFKGLSGGEKRKVRLATSMALQDLVASRATKPISLYIADEIDHALDESGLERLMAILDEKAKERGTVLTISHNSLSDWIRQTVTVKKEKGYSSLEGTALD